MTSEGESSLRWLLSELAHSPARDPDQRIGAGMMVGRYRLDERIGQGGFGVVFSATDTELGREVAVKIVRGHLADNDTVAAAFKREAALIAALAHPNVVTLHDYGVLDGVPYLVFERLRGETLGARIERQRPDARAAVAIAGEIARALEHAHQAGIVHADLKPSNVFLCDGGGVKVLDFGLARLQSDSDEKRPLRGAGTPGFMAPEQWRGEPPTPASDVFSVGVLLYDMLAGKLPFDTKGETLVDDKPAPRLSGVRARLAALVARLLAKQPSDRPRDGAALRAALDGIAPRAKRWRWALAGIAVVAAASGATVVLVPHKPKVARPPVVEKDYPKQITFDENGCSDHPALSPDGKVVIYDRLFDGDVELEALDLTNNQRRRLTFDIGRDTRARISPDGKHVAYLHLEKGQSQLRIIPFSGGTPSTIGLAGDKATWRKNRKLLAPTQAGYPARYALDDNEARILDDLPATVRVLRILEDTSGRYAAWMPLPNDKLLIGEVFRDGRPPRLFLPPQPVPGGGLELGPAGDKVYFLKAWANGQLAVAWAPRDGGGVGNWLPWDNAATDFSIAPDGHTLAFASCMAPLSIFRLRTGAAPVAALTARKNMEYWPRRIGSHGMAFVSQRNSANQVFVLDTRDGSDKPVGPRGSYDPAGSQDGKQVAFVVEGLGLAMVSAEHPEPMALTHDPSDASPAFTSDGRIVFLHNTEERRSAFILKPGGEPALLSSLDLIDIDAAPSAREVALLVRTPIGVELWRQSLDGKAERVAQVPAGAYFRVRYAPDGKRMLVATAFDVTEVPLDGGPLQILYRASGTDDIDEIDYGPDGDLWAALHKPRGDVWLAKGKF
jgi:serine/threonine protein kinase